jgi:hypothetical protein
MRSWAKPWSYDSQIIFVELLPILKDKKRRQVFVRQMRREGFTKR